MLLRAVQLLLLLVPGCAGVGCAPADPGFALLDDYRARVLRTLEGARGDAPAVRVAPWPRARDRRIDVPPQRADLLDFLRLQDCGLGALVGGRASSLGRVMRPAERLRYEHAFMEEGERCRLGLDPEEDEDLQMFLGEVLAAKRDALGAVVWNATLGSDTLAAHHAASATSLAPAGVRGAGAAATGALHGLADRAAGTVDHRSADWLDPWEVLAASRFGGRLRRSLELLAVQLEAVAVALEGRGLLCPAGRVSERARILDNVFRRYYVGAVQPYLAAVDGAAADWSDALERLAELQAVVRPRAFAPDPARQSLTRMRAARDRHTRAWQETLRACGLGPSREEGRG